MFADTSKLPSPWRVARHLRRYRRDVSEVVTFLRDALGGHYSFSVALPAHPGSWPLIQFRNHFSQTVGLFGRVVSPSQGLCLNTGQQKQNKRIHTPNIDALSWFRTHDLSVRESEDS
jgi:hypothetical protein